MDDNQRRLPLAFSLKRPTEGRQHVQLNATGPEILFCFIILWWKCLVSNSFPSECGTIFFNFIAIQTTLTHNNNNKGGGKIRPRKPSTASIMLTGDDTTVTQRKMCRSVKMTASHFSQTHLLHGSKHSGGHVCDVAAVVGVRRRPSPSFRPKNSRHNWRRNQSGRLPAAWPALIKLSTGSAASRKPDRPAATERHQQTVSGAPEASSHPIGMFRRKFSPIQGPSDSDATAGGRVSGASAS